MIRYWRGNKVRAKILIAKQLLIIINWALKVLFTEEEIETLESHLKAKNIL